MIALGSIIRAANEANRASQGDYVRDGLLVCGKCGTPKQTRVTLPGLGERVVGCMCSCADRQYREEQEARKRMEEADKLARLRSVGIVNQRLRGATFAADDGKNPGPMSKLRRYADQWEQMKKDNIGLLLTGSVGTGKSYGAACIANQLISSMVPVMMTNFASVLNTISGLRGEEKNEYIVNIMRYPLLILDDFGMERNTEYALEQVFGIIDSRYRSGKPLIVTTNLTREEMQNPRDIDHARIYDRVMEMCVPINFGSRGRRRGYAEQKTKQAADLLLGGGGDG